MKNIFACKPVFLGLAAVLGVALLAPSASFASEKGVIAFKLKLGEMANYGANPWYTDELAAGSSQMKFIFDTGANFIWATSDQCGTPACKAHQQVDTTQPGFIWVDKTIAPHSFGPWGTMDTMTGQISFNSIRSPGPSLPFFASVEYTGDKFKTLAWDGGIGFPSESVQVDQGSGFYFASLYESGAIAQPIFSIVTDVKRKKGFVYLGGEDPGQFNASSKIELQPQKNTIKYLWGTKLYRAQLGGTELPSLSNATFYLDSGSSEFKGDGVYLTPILEALQKLSDNNGKPIFEPINSDGKLIGLVYAGKGNPSMYRNILPDLTLTMGQSCGEKEGQAAKISLNAQQYSYRVQKGEYKGRWVAGFTVLDGVGGFLVGSTFMDHFYTTFKYNAGNQLSQGNMYLYTPKHGDGPAALSCVAPPLAPVQSIAGRWYNAYCSQVELTATPSGEIRGVYTSHTGSTGSSNVVGWTGKPAATASAINPYGTPVALGIQWRLINQNKCPDNSWHWVSSYSGQYFPAQVVSQAGQNSYYMDERLELLNLLEATAPLQGLAATAPLRWPQTLLFSRTAPDYCSAVNPEPDTPFHATAADYVTGKWMDTEGNMLELAINIEGDGNTLPGSVTGSYVVKATGEQYRVTGLVDPIGGALPEVVEQGVTLTMVSKTSQSVLTMVGGVSLMDSNGMELWRDTLTSTNWSGRFAESALDKTVWSKNK